MNPSTQATIGDNSRSIPLVTSDSYAALFAASGGGIIKGVRYNKGIIQAPPLYRSTTTRVTLNKYYYRFQTVVGLNDSCKSSSNDVYFTIALDMNVVYNSSLLKNGSVYLDLDVTGVTFVDLVTKTTNGTANMCSLAILGDPIILPICFNKSGNAGCSNNGVCTSFNTCNCNPGFYGPLCQFFTCFGIPYNNRSSVCSGNGNCTSFNTCVCSAGSYGPQCEKYYCAGTLSSASNVCSNNGQCLSPPTLKKYPLAGIPNAAAIYFSSYSLESAADIFLFSGGNWQDSIQWGYSSTNYVTPKYYQAGGENMRLQLAVGDFVKSITVYIDSYLVTCVEMLTKFGVRYLTAYDSFCGAGSAAVTATIPYVLSDNEYIVGFYGYWSNTSRIGVCQLGIYTQTPGTGCNCSDSYYGLDCSMFTCYGISNKGDNVCSGNGTCVAPNTCTCDPGYYGKKCEFYNCNGLMSNSTLSCSRNGVCISPNTCLCSSGYFGNNCEISSCNGILSNNISVCGSNGLCIAKDTCNCSSGYYGRYCHKWDCNGINKNNGSSCFGNGNCIAPNVCNCSGNYYGSSCQSWGCNGIAYNRSDVCSGSGTCISPDTCSCKSGYYGSDCKLYSCFGLLFSNSSVCSGNGLCASPNKCNCNDGYYGPLCQFWSCDNIPYNNNSVCSSNGT
ncbi:von Willebrand factor D and EGF domain-containing protein, partial [Acrasis kona]